MTITEPFLTDVKKLVEANYVRCEDTMDDAEKQMTANIIKRINQLESVNSNLTARLGQMLIDAAIEHTAPNVIEDMSYDMLYMADVDGTVAADLSDNMYSLARFVDPE